jgi:hypothetical protein
MEGIGAIFRAGKNVATNNRKEKIIYRGQSGEMRLCFLDMDSGDVIYY